MKQFLLLFFILTPFALFAQTFEWGQSYGLGSGNTGYNDRVSIVQYSDVLDRIVVAGNFFDSTDIEIGSENHILIQEAEGTQGFLAVYTSNGNLEYSKRIGSFISHVEFVDDSTYLVAGRFQGVFDFDRTEDSEYFLTSETIFGDGFLALYSLDGSPHWVKQFTPGFTGGPSSLKIINDQVLVSCNAQDGFVFDPTGVNTVFETSSLGGGIILDLDLESGDIEWDNTFNTNESQRINKPELLNSGEHFLIGIRSVETTNLDIGINESTVVDVSSEIGLIIPIYSVSTQELIQHLVIETDYSQAVIRAMEVNEYGELFITFSNVEDSFEIKDFHDNQYAINLPGENKTILLKFNRDMELTWVFSNDHSDGFNLYDIQTTVANELYFYGRFSNTLITNQNTYSTSTDDNLYVQRIEPDGKSSWVSYIANESGSITGTEFYLGENGQLFLGGYYQSNPNFIFSNEDDFQTLGSNAAEEGFFCKYNLGELAEQEAQVYLQTPYFDSIPEGETLNSHLFISKLPAESVEVTLTPDDQLNLGNGQGVPVVFTFDDSEPLSDQMFDVSITAFDDEAVEGEFHTGMIQIDVSSADPEFDAIESFSEELILIDDDVDAIEEQIVTARHISVYPNPADTRIWINFPSTDSGPVNLNRVEIYSSDGKLISYFTMFSSETPIAIDNLANGLYFIRIWNKNQVYYSRFSIRSN